MMEPKNVTRPFYFLDQNGNCDAARKENTPSLKNTNEKMDSTIIHNLPRQNGDCQIQVNGHLSVPLQGGYGYGTNQFLGPGMISCMPTIVSPTYGPVSYLTNDDRRELEKKDEENMLDLKKKHIEKSIDINAYDQRKQIDEIHECNKAAIHPELAFDSFGNLEYYFVDYLGNQKGSRQKLLSVKDFTAVIYKSEDPIGSEVLTIRWEHCTAEYIAFKIIHGCYAEEPKKFLEKLQQAGLTLNCSEEKKKALVALLMNLCLTTKSVYYIPHGHGWYWNSRKQEIDYYSEGITFKEVLDNVQ